MIMSSLFLAVLNMSITASYVIIIVIFVRLLLRKAPKSITYALWSVAVFRLVVPFSFKSRFSLIPRNMRIIQNSHDTVWQQNQRIVRSTGAAGASANLPPADSAADTGVDLFRVSAEIWAYIWALGILLRFASAGLLAAAWRMT